jgi:hypothetical protein
MYALINLRHSQLSEDNKENRESGISSSSSDSDSSNGKKKKKKKRDMKKKKVQIIVARLTISHIHTHMSYYCFRIPWTYQAIRPLP